MNRSIYQPGGYPLIRIFIVEDHPVMREMLREFLSLEADLVVCHDVATGQAALKEIGSHQVDLVMVDVALPDISGIEVARTLRNRDPELLLVMLSGHGEKSHVHAALQAGANGYILKGDSDEIPDALRRVRGGERYLSSTLIPTTAFSNGR